MKTGTIKSRKLIEQLFDRDNKKTSSVSAFPVRAVWMENDHQQVMVSVSKRHFHHAVDRNRIKRQIREAFRLNKEILTDGVPETAPPLAIAFIWLSDSHMPSENIHRCVRRVLHRMAESQTKSV